MSAMKKIVQFLSLAAAVEGISSSKNCAAQGRDEPHPDPEQNPAEYSPIPEFFDGRENLVDANFGYNYKTVVKTSNIPQAGRGRFADEDIPAGVWLRSVCVDGAHLKEYSNWDELNAAKDHDWVVNFIHTPTDGSEMAKKNLVYGAHPMHFHNHSPDNPNCVVVWEDGCRKTKTLRDIKKGEEFLENYGLFGKVDWFENKLAEKGEWSVRQLPDKIKEWEAEANKIPEFFAGRESLVEANFGYNFKTVVKASNIPEAGRGRFADEDIPAGEWVRSVCIDGAHLKEYSNWDELNAEKDHDWVVNFIHTPTDGSEMAKKNKVYGAHPMHFHNHSLEPNCVVVWEDGCRKTKSLRDIKKGEEFLENYGNFGKVDWFENKLAENDEWSVRQLPDKIKEWAGETETIFEAAANQAGRIGTDSSK